jgi:hypothetical protein
MYCFCKRIISLFILIIAFYGCDVARQAQQASNLANCEFRILSVDHINLAGIELQNIKTISDLGMSDVARILGGFTSPTFPLSLQLNIEGRNPNEKPTGLNRLEWILFIDEIQMTTGIFDKPFVIPSLGTLTVPVDVGLDLKQVLSGKSAMAMLNFCLNLAGTGTTPTRFKIKLKPTVIVAGKMLTYPGFITINTNYTSK